MSPPCATTDRRADNGLISASGAARSVQAQPAELSTASLQALKQRAHQLLESQRSLQQQNQALAAERLAFQSERDQLAIQYQELSAERDALQAERDSLTAHLQELTTQRDSIQQQWETLQTAVEELQGQLTVQSAQSEEQSQQREVLQGRVEELQGQLNAQQRVEEEFILLKRAYLQIFPFNSYRKAKPELRAMNDLQVANHYCQFGINENTRIEILSWDAG